MKIENQLKIGKLAVNIPIQAQTKGRLGKSLFRLVTQQTTSQQLLVVPGHRFGTVQFHDGEVGNGSIPQIMGRVSY